MVSLSDLSKVDLHTVTDLQENCICAEAGCALFHAWKKHQHLLSRITVHTIPASMRCVRTTTKFKKGELKLVPLSTNILYSVDATKIKAKENSFVVIDAKGMLGKKASYSISPWFQKVGDGETPKIAIPAFHVTMAKYKE